MKKILTNKKAFSLIELSIVILIVGIVVAGVTQSSRMITAFKLQTARNLTQSSPIASMKNLVMWFETTATASISESEADNGLSVSTWYDINPTSTTKYTATASTTARPTYTTNCRNSLPCLRFNGSSNVLTLSPEYAYTQYLTIFLVCTPQTTTDGYILSSNDGGGAPSIISKFDPGSGVKDFEWFFDGRLVIKASGSYSGLNIISLTRDNSGSVSASFNGTSAFSTSSSNDILSRSFNYIGRADIAAAYYGGDIVELILFDRVLKTEEITAIKTYLAKKWNVTVS